MKIKKCVTECDDGYGGDCFVISFDEHEKTISADIPCLHNKDIPKWEVVDSVLIIAESNEFTILDKKDLEGK